MSNKQSKKQSTKDERRDTTKISRFFRPVIKRPHPPTMDEPLINESIIDQQDTHNDTAKKRQKNDANNSVASEITIPSNADTAIIIPEPDTSKERDEAQDSTKYPGIGNGLKDANHDRNSVSVNPFQKFAFVVSNVAEASGSLPVFSIPTSKQNQSGSLPPQHLSIPNDNSRPNKRSHFKPQSHGSKTTASDWIRMKDVPEKEQVKIVHKWHTMADPSASLEDKRFQVLVAARLHARCQDGPVRKAMKELRTYFDSNNHQHLTVKAMANIEPVDLHSSIKNLQYYVTKASNLVKAAQELKVRYGGRVPEDEYSLKQITGIGPVLADLLAFVNTRARHGKASSEQQKENK
jgi:hypothetical protein